uniref:ORF6N domain-containing protein n=1 Tax=Lachnospira sp. TaxID=2049031 RepID=UPI00402A1AD6
MDEISIIEYKGARVLTTQQLAEAYGTDTQVITNNYNRNKDRYIEGKHYICLTGQELREFKTKNQNDLSLKRINQIYLWTEKGTFLHAKSLNTDTAWEVYDRLVESFFMVRQIEEELPPQMKMLYGMLDQMAAAERQAKEAKQIADSAKKTASRAVESVENIKEAVKPVFDNWREETNEKFNRIQRNTDKSYNVLRTEMYGELERRAGCDLSARLRNKRSRMLENGCTKTETNNLNKMDIIENDKKLREIFSKIVSEYEIRYCA